MWTKIEECDIKEQKAKWTIYKNEYHLQYMLP